MAFKEINTPLLTTGGVVSAIYDFIQGDTFHLIMGAAVSISVVVLNIYKIRKYIRDEKNK